MLGPLLFNVFINDLVYLDLESEICNYADDATIQDLKRKTKRIWNMRSVIVVPVIVGALGSIPKKLTNWLEKFDITVNTALIQKTKLLGTARTVRKVLEY